MVAPHVVTVASIAKERVYDKLRLLFKDNTKVEE